MASQGYTTIDQRGFRVASSTPPQNVYAQQSRSLRTIVLTAVITAVAVLALTSRLPTPGAYVLGGSKSVPKLSSPRASTDGRTFARYTTGQRDEPLQYHKELEYAHAQQYARKVQNINAYGPQIAPEHMIRAPVPTRALVTSRRSVPRFPYTPIMSQSQSFAGVKQVDARTSYKGVYQAAQPVNSFPRKVRSAARPVRAATAALTTTSQCEQGGTGHVLTYGKCPNKCEDFNMANFMECDTLAQFGCGMKQCASGKYVCGLMSDFVSGKVVCPGDKIVFDSVSVDELHDVSYFVDLKNGAQKTDIYLMTDATASMKTAIAMSKSQSLEILDIFAPRGDVSFGVGFYRDESNAELKHAFKNQQGMTKDVAKIQRAINAWRIKSNPDYPEGNLQAYNQVAEDPTIGWRAGSRRILVTYGDDVGHEPSCLLGRKLRREDVIKNLQAKGITVVTVNFGVKGRGIDVKPVPYPNAKSCSGRAAGTGQGTAIASATGGDVVSTGDQTELVEKIKELVDNLERTFDVDDSQCDANIRSVHTPALPLTLEPTEDATVKNTMTLKQSVCDKGQFDCQFRYLESGADVGEVEIEVVNVIGCPE